MNESTLSVALYASELDDFEVFERAVFDRICAIGRAGTRLAGQAETAAASLHDLGSRLTARERRTRSAGRPAAR